MRGSEAESACCIMILMKDILEKIKRDPRYLKNIEFGEPRPGHPEGKVKFHIRDLENNLELLWTQGKVPDRTAYWKLKFLIHVHDAFKAEAETHGSPHDPKNHAFIARQYASRFTENEDLLNMIQFHDENYKLWREYRQTGRYDGERFQRLLETIQDWDLFLLFIIIDGCTAGKEYAKLSWFIGELKKHKATRVEASWVLPQADGAR